MTKNPHSNMKKKILQQKFIPIILGSSINGYGVVRSFFEKGIRTIVIDSAKGPAFFSRFAESFICGDSNVEDTSLIHILGEVYAELKLAGSKGIIFPTSDKYLFFIGRNENYLREMFYIAMSDWNTVEDCTNKTLMYKKARQLGIPYPITFYCESTHEIRECMNQIPFPLLIKPEITIGFTEKLGLGKKAVVINNRQDLLKLLERMDNNGLSNTKMIVQEVIEGGADQLHTITTYSNREGKIYAYSIGHKIRQFPPDAGTIRSGKVENVDGLYQLTDKLLQGMHFHGIANTEYKYDKHNDVYKLIEINPRPGLWNYSATAAGVNLPYICFLDIIGQYHFTKTVNTENVITWYIDFRDYYEAVYKNKKLGYSDYIINTKQWKESLGKNKVKAVYNLRDPIPSLFFAIDNITAFFRRK